MLFLPLMRVHVGEHRSTFNVSSELRCAEPVLRIVTRWECAAPPSISGTRGGSAEWHVWIFIPSKSQETAQRTATCDLPALMESSPVSFLQCPRLHERAHYDHHRLRSGCERTTCDCCPDCLHINVCKLTALLAPVGKHSCSFCFFVCLNPLPAMGRSFRANKSLGCSGSQ